MIFGGVWLFCFIQSSTIKVWSSELVYEVQEDLLFVCGYKVYWDNYEFHI